MDLKAMSWQQGRKIVTDLCSNKKEQVNHPNHYNQGKYEVIDVINDWKLDFNLGNAIKYIARCDYKGKPIEDLEKARFYLDYEINKRKELNNED